MSNTISAEQVSHWLAAFEAALSSGDIAAATDLFDDDCYWRDLLSFTWNIKTLEGKEAVKALLAAKLDRVQPRNWTVSEDVVAASKSSEAWFTFETDVGIGVGHIRLKEGKCRTLFTSLDGLKDFPEKTGSHRDKGQTVGVIPGRKSWLDRKQTEEALLGHSEQPYCLIIGGGQGGIALGARLKQLDVPTLIIEKNERAGDSWRKRYKSLCLHDPVWYDHLPYIPFPENWPVYSPKDKIADWLEMYAKVMELNYWGGTECQNARYDEVAEEWVVSVTKNGEKLTLRPKQLVLATGMSGMPNIPTFDGAERFTGELHHSSGHPGGEPYAGKKCVVIGANTSAHDISADLWEHGADVTMIQRSSTCIVGVDNFTKVNFGDLYSEEAVQAGITTEQADMIVASQPYALAADAEKPRTRRIAEMDADILQRLEKVGFLLDFGDDGSGLPLKYLRRGSGYYMDVGASELVADGKVKLRSGVGVREMTENGVVLSDGSELPADLIVLATGYGSMNGWAAKLISQEVADKVGRCWGLGSDTTNDPGPWEGEQRNMWKPTHQEALWFHGGNLHQSRHYSKYLALQLKARLEGVPTPVYGMEPVYHLS
ncbi:MAG: NAD(P)/FAD-dependent oxidoreductase [Pseudomonadota bacterium]